MPANLSPEYKKADEAWRRAREPRERLECLREMLRSIPKHKGTERLQGDIKSRIKELSDELAGPRKGGHAESLHAVRREGAAQICLVGPPNAGKSSLHALLTGSHAAAGPYPGTTRLPLPGMLPFEDIHIQLVDLPPIAADHIDPWLPGLLRFCDGVLLVVDLADAACLDHVSAIRAQLGQRRISLSETWPGLSIAGAQADEGDERNERGDALSDPFRTFLPTLLLANKCDLDPAPGEVQVLEDLLGVRYPALATSALSGQGLNELAPLLFRALALLRVYTKAPGKAAERSKPFTVRRGQTVLDVARLVHQDIADSLKYARLWGSGSFDGQQVGPEHVVADGDLVELHTR